MNKLYPCLFLCLFAALATSAFAGISVTSPTNGAQLQSSVHFVATAQSPSCSKGVASMGVYTAPYKLAFSVTGSKLDTYLTLSAGTYNTVIQEWDNCGWSAGVPVTITVGSSGAGSSSGPGSSSNVVLYASKAPVKSDYWCCGCSSDAINGRFRTVHAVGKLNVRRVVTSGIVKGSGTNPKMISLSTVCGKT